MHDLYMSQSFIYIYIYIDRQTIYLRTPSIMVSTLACFASVHVHVCSLADPTKKLTCAHVVQAYIIISIPEMKCHRGN